MLKLTLRVDFESGERLGPGKVRLLELIDETGSIAAAGRHMGMSYRRAWLLVESVNGSFAERSVLTRPGGSGGGGAELTAFGRSLIGHYRAMESKAETATRAHMKALEAAAASAADDER
ncbi:MAG: LysR family transcriptional regulator [Gammaproteobacteria bacterium]|nr:LysR family transcriptional regulator [Gammaproteobacteria bacterium]